MKHIPYTIFLVMVFFVLSSPVMAQTASSYKVDHFIEYSSVLVDIQAGFEEPVTGKFVYELPLDASSILLYVDDKEAEPQLVGNRVVVSLDENTEFILEYISKSSVSKSELITVVQHPFPTEKTRIKVSLPSDARLREPVSSISRSIFPKPDDLYTDGQNIDLVWEFEDIEKGEDVPLMVKFVIPKGRYVPWLIGALVLVLLVLGYVLVTKREKIKEKVVVKEVVKEVKDGGYESHLKEDEAQIVRILKMKEGSCEQGTLRVATGFSKAKLSGLLKEMEERKIIHKEKRGKKNCVFLKKE